MKAFCHADGISKTYRLDRIINFRRVSERGPARRTP